MVIIITCTIGFNLIKICEKRRWGDSEYISKILDKDVKDKIKYFK